MTARVPKTSEEKRALLLLLGWKELRYWSGFWTPPWGNGTYPNYIIDESYRIAMSKENSRRVR